MISELIGQINRLDCHVNIIQSRHICEDCWDVFVHENNGGAIVAHTVRFKTLTGALHNALQLTREAKNGKPT